MRASRDDFHGDLEARCRTRKQQQSERSMSTREDLIEAAREGEALIFDDSLEHWVAFDAEPTAQRIVLVADVPHPDWPWWRQPLP